MANKNNIHIVELGRVTTPDIVEKNNRDYVEYGEDNNYFDFIIQRYLNSTTNKTVIDSVCNWIYGKGLSATDSNIKVEQYASMIGLIGKQDLKRFIKDRYMLGMAAFQIVKNKGKITSVTHFPMETLRAGKLNDNGELDTWFYHNDWSNKKLSDKPKQFPAFGFGNGNSIEMYVCKPYTPSYSYYAPINYSLEYPLLEEEIADYLLNDVQNGFSGTKVINFNNGEPDEQRQVMIKNSVINKLTGASGEKVIVAFNSDESKKTTVDNIPLDNAPEHYQYLSDECRNKILLSHKVTSPLLLGIREAGGGLGSNADEIKNATLLFSNIVIKPLQEEVLDIIEQILAVNGIALNIYFKTIEPLEFMDVDGLDEETKEEETGIDKEKEVSLSKDAEISSMLIEKADNDMEGWELIDEEDVDYDTEDDLDAELAVLNNPKKSLLSKVYNFVRTGTARPNSKSEQDKEIENIKYKVRYKYFGEVRDNTREFCRKMIAADKLYRKEDIIAMDNQVVNAGWGLSGADTYSIWKFKGGGGCGHHWKRMTFKFTGKGKADVKSPTAEKVSTNKAEKDGYRVRNPKEVSMKPRDMKNRGFVNK